jgi:lauroyl/myristoyl acyltransferase
MSKRDIPIGDLHKAEAELFKNLFINEQAACAKLFSLYESVRAYFRYEAEPPRQHNLENDMRAAMYAINDHMERGKR